MEKPTLDQVRQLTAMHQETVPADYMDENGHMNVRYYFELAERAYNAFYASLGLGKIYASADVYGTFALEQHVRYFAEIMAGDEVSVHVRLAALSPKRSYKIGFLVNDTRDQLAAMVETVAMNIDMRKRRGAPFPAEPMAALTELLSRHQSLDWAAPVCGIMRV